MDITDHVQVGGGRIAIVMHDDLVAALDHLAAEHGATRSHQARRILADHLQAAGLLQANQPMTPRAGRRRART